MRLTAEMIDERLAEHRAWQERETDRLCLEVVLEIVDGPLLSQLSAQQRRERLTRHLETIKRTPEAGAYSPFPDNYPGGKEHDD